MPSEDGLIEKIKKNAVPFVKTAKSEKRKGEFIYVRNLQH